MSKVKEKHLVKTEDARKQTKQRYERALESFSEKLKTDPNVTAIIVYGSMARNDVWEKSDIDVYVLVRDVKLSQTGFCIEEDGIFFNVEVYKEFDYCRHLERDKGNPWFFSIHSTIRLVYCVNESLKEFLTETAKMGSGDRALTFFNNAAWLIGDMEKIEQWLWKGNLPYAQGLIFNAAHSYANMLLILNNKPPHRDAIIRVMEFAPELMEPVFLKPMRGEMKRSDMENTIGIFQKFLEDNIELLKQPVEDYMSDGQIRTVTALVKHFNWDSHAIYHIFEFLAEKEVVCRTGEPAKITLKSRKTVEEAAYIYTGENKNDKRFH
ncbi:MAG: nucleotidyltransferase domain-containing protein [Treponema sp.]|nr:nucleotidyltransferase domain-containing protein [Treponema sp.]